jgi:BirA family biotin operon repressor/biotin-[acetyl-CoA-carboxylase] ligase
MASYFTNMDNSVIGCEVVYNPITESTNSLATNALAGKAAEGITFVADYQSKGRGQRGNFWESEAGKNLTFSVLAYPSFLEIYDHFYLSKVVANGVAEALLSLNVEARIKWPNDIYVGDLKIAGILIENGLMGISHSHSIWGVGLNVNQRIFRSDAPNPTSLVNLLGEELDRNEVLHAVLRCMNGWYERLKKGLKSEIDEFYFATLFRKDGFYKFEADGIPFKAKISSIEHTGELVLETEEGELRSFAFKEVSFII